MSETPPSRWSELRDFCAAIRELIVFVAVAALIFAPGVVRNVLERAGIRAFAGVEFDAQTLAEAQSELELARGQMDDLRRQLAMAQGHLGAIASRAAEPTGGAGPIDIGPSGGEGPPERLMMPEAMVAQSSSPVPPTKYEAVSRLLSQMQEKCEQTEQTLQRSSKLHDKAVGGVKLRPLEELLRERDRSAAAQQETRERM